MLPEDLKGSIRGILQESITFEAVSMDPGPISYSMSLGFNDDKKNIIKQFVDYVSKILGIKKMPKINFVAEKIGSMTTGAYNPQEDKIYVLAQGRLLADILRTVAHELVHTMQRETGKFKVGETVQDAGGPIENEANAKAGELLKTFVRDLKMDVIYSI
jgi:hypothetical protein